MDRRWLVFSIVFLFLILWKDTISCLLIVRECSMILTFRYDFWFSFYSLWWPINLWRSGPTVSQFHHNRVSPHRLDGKENIPIGTRYNHWHTSKMWYLRDRNKIPDHCDPLILISLPSRKRKHKYALSCLSPIRQATYDVDIFSVCSWIFWQDSLKSYEKYF